jgi:hypothetical protein
MNNSLVPVEKELEKEFESPAAAAKALQLL